MKRLFFMLLAAATLVACGKVDDDTPKPIDPTKPTMRYVKKATSQSSSDRGDSYRSVMAYEYDDQMRIVKMVNQSTEIYAGTTTEHNSNIYFTYKDNTISIKSREVKDGVEQEAQDALAITLNPDGTTKQSVTFGVFTSNSDTETESKPAPFPFLTRSSASKATIITKYKTTFDYTYDAQGYVTKIKKKRETENGTVTQGDDYSVLWSSGNLIKVETTYEGKKVYDEFKYSNIENKLCNWDMSLMAGEWSSEAFNVVGQLGLMGERNKYLPSSITTASYSGSSSGNITTYSHQYTYKLDKDGYVIELVETGAGNSTYNDNVTIEYVK